MATSQSLVGRAVVLACGLLAWAPMTAHADEGPYSSSLVGERAMGLGGAFVAVADDTSALFHNPSGLASMGSSAYSGGFWTYFGGSRSIDEGYDTGLGTARFQHSARLVIPAFLGGAVKFGKRDPDGVRPHAIGVALLSPYVHSYSLVAQLDGDGAVDRIDVKHDETSQWLGVSYAYRLRPGLALGLTVFGAQRNVGHSEVELRAREPAADGSLGTTFARASSFGISDYQLIARLGMHVDLARELRAGVMLQPPGVRFAGEASARYVDTRVGPTDPTTVVIERDDDIGYNLRTPWELRFGLAYLAHGGSLISLDLSVLGPAGDPSDPLPLIETDNDGYGLFVPRATYRRPSLRGALGFEAELIDSIPLRGGIFFERSSAPEVLSRSSVYVRELMDRVGTALSIGLRTSGYDLSIGINATVGTGEALGLVRNENPGEHTYRASEIRDTRFVIFVGGARHAVRQLVESVFEPERTPAPSEDGVEKPAASKPAKAPSR